ncbi:chorismate mutase [Streptomyces pathocidini]|uniref:chorismate mutase n=1 Tax=Streptomyces pathocidini TaxID=1650571 RepID=A0ABW7URF2_9ACTN|nr:chorismate mutase [Streptomyces pathocidini]
MLLTHHHRFRRAARRPQGLALAAIGTGLAASLLLAAPAHAVASDAKDTTTATQRADAGHQSAAQHVRALARLAAERVLTADQVAASKWISGAPIEDPEREQQVLDAMDAEAQRLGIDRATVQRVFRDQMEANKYVQRQLHDRWRENPAEAPTMAPDLTEIREEINRINIALLSAIQGAQPLLSKPQCSGVREMAYRTAVHELRLDALHKQGLRRALTGLCANS